MLLNHAETFHGIPPPGGLSPRRHPRFHSQDHGAAGAHPRLPFIAGFPRDLSRTEFLVDE